MRQNKHVKEGRLKIVVLLSFFFFVSGYIYAYMHMFVFDDLILI